MQATEHVKDASLNIEKLESGECLPTFLFKNNITAGQMSSRNRSKTTEALKLIGITKVEELVN